VAREIGWITFDCYGTLIDWESGIFQAFSTEAARAGWTIERQALLAAYHEIEPQVEAGEYRRYRDVLAESAVLIAERFGLPIPRERASFLAESLPSWPPFPDTNPALARLAAAGVHLGILSNVDEDLLAGTRRHLDAEFDLIVTADQVRCYKPGLAHFRAARQRLGPSPRWLHAAQSYLHDVDPCKALGIPVAWINRKRETAGPAGAPDYEFPDLTGLAEAWSKV
jgi:2-haloalkanoic acid dehalogenase type II